MSREQHHRKVVDCLATGGLAVDEAHRLIEQVERLETLPSWDPILGLLSRAGHRDSGPRGLTAASMKGPV